MNQMSSRTATADHVLLRKSETYSVLDRICQNLELSLAQLEAAEVSYTAVANWLAGSGSYALQGVTIYPHGSTAVGTTVKPIGRDEYDVDLICLSPEFSSQASPAELKRIVGERLREHGTYAGMLEEKKRCWRLNYAHEFHLDISPTVPNPACTNGGELVPDKQARIWKPTNPKGFKALFERRASLRPRLRIFKAIAAQDSARSIEAYPRPSDEKSILCRIVQLLKRHRDVMFEHVADDVAPISVIITTLAAQAYEYCVKSFEFDTELDVVYETIRMMPHFIEHPVVAGKRLYLVANETTQGENFAERWNTEPARAKAFDAWHERAVADFEGVASLEGVDAITKGLEKALGGGAVRKAMDERTRAISSSRATGGLYVAPAVGLTMTSSARATPVPKNTYFGDRLS